jgi:hypothetical protein
VRECGYGSGRWLDALRMRMRSLVLACATRCRVLLELTCACLVSAAAMAAESGLKKIVRCSFCARQRSFLTQLSNFFPVEAAKNAATNIARK